MTPISAGSRYAGRRVGLLVLIALALIFVASLQSTLIRDLLRPVRTIYLLLPEAGVAGLSRGANVEVLGTPAGMVREIVIDPEESFHAVVEIDERMVPFVRRDSRGIIRRQYGIAGAAYVEITRGTGLDLDWDYPVLTAETDRAPTDNIGELVDELRSRVFPIVEETHRAITALADLIEGLERPDSDLQLFLANLRGVSDRLEQGEGTIGRLLTDDTLIAELEATAAVMRGQLTEVDQIMENLQDTTANVSRISNSLADPSAGLPALLGSASSMVAELSRATPEVVATSRELPMLLSQTERTLQELEALLVALQHNWLIGGGEQPPALGTRPSPQEIRP